MSVALTNWLKDLLPHTPGIVRSVARREVIKAAREFFRDSTAWREVVQSAYFADGAYALTAVPQSTDSEVLTILSVEANGVPLTLKAERPTGDRPDGTPTCWYPVPGTVDGFEVWPTPDQYDDEILVRVVLIPTDAATSLPDVAARRHFDGILDGALGRVYGHPAKPYSNPTLAEYHLRRFRNAISKAKGEVQQGAAAGQNWVYPKYGK